MIACNDAAVTASVVHDSEGNVWTNDGQSAGFWYLENAQPNANLVVFVDWPTGSATADTFVYFDIIGALSTPFDSAVAAGTSQNLNSVTSYTPSSLPSPSVANELVIANIALGQGPGLALPLHHGHSGI